jgi:AcrR family transcriptional regulator
MPTMDDKPPIRRRLTAGQRRESILAAAVDVFTATGYRASKVSDIAARVGVSEPVIFQNFGSKAALFAAVLDRVGEETRAHLQTLIEQFGSVSDVLAHVLNPSQRPRRHSPQAHGALFADAITLAAEPDLPEPARTAIRAVADHLADLLRRGQADGDIRADVDPGVAAWLLLSVLAARPFRLHTMPDTGNECRVAALALSALRKTE